MGHDNADNADKGDTCRHGDRLPASSHTPSQPHSLTEKLSTQIVNAENIPGAGAMSVGVRCSEAGPSSCPLAPSSAGEVQLDTSHAPAQTTQNPALASTTQKSRSGRETFPVGRVDLVNTFALRVDFYAINLNNQSMLNLATPGIRLPHERS